jgi:hypothetical protein
LVDWLNQKNHFHSKIERFFFAKCSLFISHTKHIFERKSAKSMNKYFLVLFSFFCLQSFAQNQDSIIIKKITDEVLTNGKAYADLHDLCKQIGNRISGSEQAAKAVQLMFNKMKAYGFDSVWLQPVMVPKWIRGSKKTEIGKIIRWLINLIQ